MLYLFPGDTSFSGNDLIETEDWKVMQFTGLLDKNGKEIYEGDIIFNEHDELKKYPVVFEKGMFCVNDWTMPLWKGDTKNFWEIIGNIYENPDLL